MGEISFHPLLRASSAKDTRADRQGERAAAPQTALCTSRRAIVGIMCGACLPPLVTSGVAFRVLRVLVDARQEDCASMIYRLLAL